MRNIKLPCVLLLWVPVFTLIRGECWNAKVQYGVRCRDVFKSFKTSSNIQCYRNCLATSRCCSVNYIEDQNTCEFCTAGPSIMMVYDGVYSYIGYSIHQEQCGEQSNSSHAACYPDAETFNKTKEACFDKKEEFNQSISMLTNGGSCVRWDDPTAVYSHFNDSYFVADGMSKSVAKNYCRHPRIPDDDIYNAPFLFCLPADPYIDKAMCAIRSCGSTNLDQCGAPPSLRPPAVRSYPVVGDVYLAYYRCSSYSGGLTPSPHCPVSRCIGTNNWTNTTISCSASDCYPTGKMTSYAGKRTCTESGRTCQAWALDYPHSHTYESLRNDLSNGNYCRGTDDSKPWCYTTDPGLRWELCGVPEC